MADQNLDGLSSDNQGATPGQTQATDSSSSSQPAQSTAVDPANLNPVTGEPAGDVPQETAQVNPTPPASQGSAQSVGNDQKDNTAPATTNASPLDNLQAANPPATPVAGQHTVEVANTSASANNPQPAPPAGSGEATLKPLGSNPVSDSETASTDDQPELQPQPLPSNPEPGSQSTPAQQPTSPTIAGPSPSPVSATEAQPSPSQSDSTDQGQAAPGNVSAVQSGGNDSNDDQEGEGGSSTPPAPTGGNSPASPPPADSGGASADSAASTGLKGAGKYSVKVIGDKCIGAASCVAIAPKAFKLGDDQIAQVLDTVKDETDENLLLAAQSCPVMAIEVHDAETGQKVWPK